MKYKKIFDYLLFFYKLAGHKRESFYFFRK